MMDIADSEWISPEFMRIRSHGNDHEREPLATTISMSHVCALANAESGKLFNVPFCILRLLNSEILGHVP